MKKISENYKPMRVWLFTNLPRVIVACDLSSSSELVSNLSWQNKYPNMKTTCDVKLKFFVWIKLLKNLLIAKYLVSVAAALKLQS